MKRCVAVLLALCILAAVPFCGTAASAAKTKDSAVAALRVSAAGQGRRTVKLTWKADDRCNVYRIWRNGKDIGSVKTAGFTDTEARAGKINTYEIKGYRRSGGKNGAALCSGTARCYPMDAPSGVTVKRSGSKATVSWTAVTGAESYEVYYATSRDGGYRKVKTAAADRTSVNWENDAVGVKTLYFRVRAARDDGSLSSYSAVAELKKAEGKLHTLFIFEESYGGVNITTTAQDMDFLRRTLRIATPLGLQWESWGGSREHVLIDRTKTQIKSAIASMAAHSGKNDVCLFFMSSHGYMGTEGRDAGALLLPNGHYMRLEELAAALKKIPGKVVVILSSCGGGAAINKGAEAAEKAWTNAVVSAFRSVNSEIVMEIGAGKNSLRLSVGEFRYSKFHVICGAAMGTSDYFIPGEYSYLNKWIYEGVSSKGAMTMREMASWLKKKGAETLINGRIHQQPVCYPNDDFKLFRKIAQ